MTRFTGKVAIVTGAAQGIGAATARLLATEGATVAVLDLTAERAQGTVDAITAAGGSARAYGCDVADHDAVETVFAQVAADLGAIHILVNNAGITRDNLFFKMPKTDWDAVLTVNLTSAYNCSHVAQKYMCAQKYGKIVSLSSRSALGNRGQANYAAAKAGIQGLTATLAIELGPFNVNVNAVAPGYMATDNTAALQADPVRNKSILDRIPAGRWGTPADLTGAVIFLAAPASDYMHGHILAVDGGWLVR
jgi:3-oxoacyl-[acyl-carrier protein] reductase